MRIASAFVAVLGGLMALSVPTRTVTAGPTSPGAPFGQGALALGDLELPAATPREVVFRLDAPSTTPVDLLAPFRDASIERLGPMRLYLAGRWGRRTSAPWMQLSWSDAAPSDAPLAPMSSELQVQPFGEPFADSLGESSELDDAISRERDFLRAFPGVLAPTFSTTGPSLESDGYGAFFLLPPTKPVVDWRCRRKPVTIVRYGAEQDQVELVRCDGTMAPEALDRLSILARPPEVPRPTGLLPEEPDAAAWDAAHEWVPGVRVAHPRLVWALQRIADAFPRRAIYVYSGYRPNAEVHDGTGHKSLHGSGRALDIAVFRVPNEEVFKACRELKDVGCGFYPHNKFIHLDVRRAHSGKAIWIDASKPGEPADYVDGWPGVVDSGALGWSPPKK